MRRWSSLLAALALLSCFACSSAPPGRPDAGSALDGGGGGGDGNGAFTLTVLDPAASERMPLSLAITAQDRVGVAYFASVTAPDGGGEYEVRYAEWSASGATSPQRVRTVQRPYGLSLAFQSNGEPAVAYLGGGSDQSVFWLQSDAALSYRTGGSAWAEQIAVRRGNEAPCGNAVSDRGFLVGLNPALVFDGAKAYLAYRDGHDGQFPQQDWAGSDLELAEGTPGAWTPRCLVAGGNDKQAHGGHIQMVMANGQPALIYDHVFGSAEGTGQDIHFLKRQASGTWTRPTLVQSVGNTQSGASLAYDATEGFGVAVVERSENKLSYVRSLDGATWTVADPVFQSGSGGWYPSLAMDPQFHEPAIAFYVCSPRPGVNEGSCQASEDDLRISQRTANNWREVVVDEAGGVFPKLGFLSSAKRVVAYRDPSSGALKLAVEK